MIALIAAMCIAHNGNTMIVPQTWSNKTSCDQVENPDWPLAYQKYPQQVLERKGRVNSNRQDMRHSCQVRDVLSRCHKCQSFQCGKYMNQTCSYQIQGVDYDRLPKNIPTVTDIPFAIKGLHRYDYKSATHYCMFISGEACLSPFTENISSCAIRCWGYKAQVSLQKNSQYPPKSTMPSEIWSQKILPESSQGFVKTLAGSEQGYVDGDLSHAQFDYPQALDVDSKGIIYVADTGNHCVRRIDPLSGQVTTVAGTGISGFVDGPSNVSQFSHPSGIAVFEDLQGDMTLFVSDTGNHRIRKIHNGVVSCIAGLCGNGIESPRQQELPATPHPGFADGDGNSSRYDTPIGITVNSEGFVFVADSGNHLIRLIDPNGTTRTIAGHVIRNEEENIPGCVSPCARGVSGSRDGSARFAQFQSPNDVTIGPENSLYIVDGHRLRQLKVDSQNSWSEVITIVGSNSSGDIDGLSSEATLQSPDGVLSMVDGRILVVSSINCNIRAVSSFDILAKPIYCDTKAFQVFFPIGCSSYEPSVDEYGNRGSPISGNIYYSFMQRNITNAEEGTNVLGRRLWSCQSPIPKEALEIGNLSLPHVFPNGSRVSSIREDFQDGSTIIVKCPSDCHSNQLFGSSYYSEESSVCLAAIHAGVLSAAGGIARITLERSIYAFDSSVVQGSSSHGVQSMNLSVDNISWLFSVSSISSKDRYVQTIAGSPSAPRSSACGFFDSLPQHARFNSPSDIVRMNTSSVLIADSGNHRIRIMTAACSKICENGGRCTATDTCACADGWKGDDCTVPLCDASVPCFGSNPRYLCVGPNSCHCIPGYADPPQCLTPQCVQTCANGGLCTAPDTCSCPSGWFDSNCTTPVCHQTCGNNGNCTSPNVCTCAKGWKGIDCRLPICMQECYNGGSCIAPNTCQCAEGYSGTDCSNPVCSQGFFVPSSIYAEEAFVPCHYEEFCRSTNDFDCQSRNSVSIVEPTQPFERSCELIELGIKALTHFTYLNERDEQSAFYRFSPPSPYKWSASNTTWRGIQNGSDFETYHSSSMLEPDRQLAYVRRRREVVGEYQCANSGQCIAPDTCRCSRGWIGFDCRTPVCSQGYFNPNQSSFFMNEPMNISSNPVYERTKETLSYEDVYVQRELREGVRYAPQQGGYACSIRSITQWERPAIEGKHKEFYSNHPNYFSAYMDNEGGWKDMKWPPLYKRSTPKLDETRNGYERAGIWQRVPGTFWVSGVCTMEYLRVCEKTTNTRVYDPDASFRSQTELNVKTALRLRYWNATETGNCIDHVIRGCYNNGTCVAPDTCVCAAGWTGSDCSIPICENSCQNNGNCTLPNRCTCEIGWTGERCTIPLCAQDCRNGGKCVAPDTCECVRWRSQWRNGRNQSKYSLPNSRAMLTGYTGYDCNTPICVQAEKFILNTNRSAKGFYALQGQLNCTSQPCAYEEELVSNDGSSFQSGCSVGKPYPNPRSTLNASRQLELLHAYKDSLNQGRISDEFLCGNFYWEQGDYVVGRYNRTNYVKVDKGDNGVLTYGSTTSGEGIYMCYNRGACIAPDTCTCAEGYTGIDCSIPLCRFTNTDGAVSFGCHNNGICIKKNVCQCRQYNSTLYQTYPNATRGITGHIGPNCSIPVCTQGEFDPSTGVYRCSNNGSCVAPDLCKCTDGWSGSDCTTPVCHVQATKQIRSNFPTADEAIVTQFESDPCGETGVIWGKTLFNGSYLGHGNCTRPYTCTCLCLKHYNETACKSKRENCEKPWKDFFRRQIPKGYTYGTGDCVEGFQGLQDGKGRYLTCHLKIYVPTFYRRYTVPIIAGIVASVFVLMILACCLRNAVGNRLVEAQLKRAMINSKKEE